MTRIGKKISTFYGTKGGGGGFIPSYFETFYTQSAEGEDLIDAKGGTTIPYVSGFGVNQLFDFSVLSDDRWNKNAYVGNAFALPEYFDFPYLDEIYFDTANPFYWRVRDFHYRYYEEQAVGITNLSFARLRYDDFGYGATNSSSGLMNKASTDAYGVWEFEISKKSDPTNENINIISSDTTLTGLGYQFVISATEQIKLNRTGETIVMASAAGYIDIDVIYGIKITRNSILDEYVTGAIGTFAIYIKGGSFGNTYVLMDVTGGAGTNPKVDNVYTTSAYMVFDFDPGDYIRNLDINGTLQNFYDFTQTTGVFEIDNLKSFDALLLYIEGKGLECISVGETYNASTDAYGEWEFDINKGTGIARILFISNDITINTNDYSIQLRNTGSIRFLRSFNTVFETASSYISQGVDYTIKVTRNSVLDEYVTGAIGTFAVYIKGGSFGDTYVLVDVTGGSGTNPVTDNTYTTSAYTVLDFDAGDQIANYYINGTQLDTRDFTVSSGEYTVTSALVDPELSQIKSLILILNDYYGDELVINGGFDTDTFWNKGAGWTISGGACNALDVGGTSLNQSSVVVANKEFSIVYEVVEYASGNIKFTLEGGTVGGITRDSVGIYEEIKTATNTGALFFGRVTVLFTGKIDNVSVKQYFHDYYKNEEQ